MIIEWMTCKSNTCYSISSSLKSNSRSNTKSNSKSNTKLALANEFKRTFYNLEIHKIMCQDDESIARKYGALFVYSVIFLITFIPFTTNVFL